METKHTPGLWTKNKYADLIGANGKAICVKGLGISHILAGDDFPEERANGDLMAASEAMFSALDGLINNGFSDDELARRWSWPVEAITEARKAFAQAKGE